ncbi:MULTISPECIES: TetR/AcrR family transcriptional regulator [unclassified Agrococcus]|uniref:TetR/AcrR family transcriptional regulator n=1 Tax=unclassified Agrococcus TaxID=2615065 RepID=UPI00360D7F88
MSEPRTPRGADTKRRILAAAEEVLDEQGYPQASVARITDRAGVGQGTFYLYFASKPELLERLVDELGEDVRRAVVEGAAGAATTAEAGEGALRAHLAAMARRPALHRVVREAEHVAPDAMRRHRARLVDGYVEALARTRAASGGDVDPEVAAWALLGIGELVGMRWVLRRDDGQQAPRLPGAVLDQTTRLIRRALDAKEER